MTRPAWRRLLLGAAIALAGAALPAALEAQSSAIPVDADISSILLSVDNSVNLRFGTVVPGVPVTLAPRTGTTVGAFVIHGNRNAEVAVSFVLPTQLVVGPYTMPITFGTLSGCWRKTTGQAGCTRYDPHTALVQRIRNANAPNNTLFMWLGGTVSPAAGQHPGFYSATVGVTVVYTGN